jgi:hypothetical protein
MCCPNLNHWTQFFSQQLCYIPHVPLYWEQCIICFTICNIYKLNYFVCLFCFESHEQFFSYLATVTITGNRAANLDLCLALAAFSSEGSIKCHTYCDMGPPFLRSYPKDPWFSLLNAVLLTKEQSLPFLNVLGLTRSAWAGLEITTSRLLSESTTTRLRQPVKLN